MNVKDQRRIYISGPMSGLPEYNHPAFFQAQQQLTQAGLQSVNPASFVTDINAT